MGTALVLVWAPAHQLEFCDTLVGGHDNHFAGQGSVSSVPDDKLVVIA